MVQARTNYLEYKISKHNQEELESEDSGNFIKDEIKSKGADVTKRVKPRRCLASA